MAFRAAKTPQNQKFPKPPNRPETTLSLAPPIRLRRPTAFPISACLLPPKSLKSLKTKKLSNIAMKEISFLLMVVVLLLLCGGCGQESAEVRLFKATKIKAEQGDADAQHKLGNMYFFGEGVP